ncbi:MAG: DUF4271 domain-containing protein, partial [Flavitalea sp.]
QQPVPGAEQPVNRSGQQPVPDTAGQLRMEALRLDSIRQDSLRRVAIGLDSVRKDSLRMADSVSRAIRVAYQDSVVIAASKKKIAGFQEFLSKHPYYKFSNPRIELRVEVREHQPFEGTFYYLLGLIFLFALIRLIFYKYLANMTSLFFRVTMRQQQVREQLLQTPLASLLLNIFFVLSGGTYLTFIAQHYHLADELGFWMLLLYSIAFVAALYIGKFIFLKMVGWLFNVEKATEMYTFIVFLVNKMLGIALLPFLVLLALPESAMQKFIMHLSLILIGFLFLYRFFISYRPVRNEIKVNKFHFFLYLCAFEITPLILIYKVLLNFVETGI